MLEPGCGTDMTPLPRPALLPAMRAIGLAPHTGVFPEPGLGAQAMR